MEGVPMDNQEVGLSFEEQISLAQQVYDTVQARERFTEPFGGFDTFSEVGQYVNDNRAKFDELANEALRARTEFDEKVSDKKQIVESLRNSGKTEMADLISMMFRVPKTEKPKGSFISRMFKK